MNQITRMLVTTGLGLVAGVTFAAGPAAAATSTAPSSTQSTTTAAPAPRGDRVVGYFNNVRRCVLAGRIGERFGRWDSFACKRVRWGFHRGEWALVVERHGWPGNHHGWPGDNHGWPGHHHGGPGGPGPFMGGPR